MVSAQLKKIGAQLWATAESDRNLNIYTVLDAARDKSIHPRLREFKVEGVPLFRGEQAYELAAVGPYLIRLYREDPFTDWLLANCWGASWGLFVLCPAPLDELKRHFQSFLIVYDEEGIPLYFRYYDPRVLRVYLPTCTSSELGTVFGPIKHYLMEGEDGNSMIEYSLSQGKLKERLIEI